MALLAASLIQYSVAEVKTSVTSSPNRKLKLSLSNAFRNVVAPVQLNRSGCKSVQLLKRSWWRTSWLKLRQPTTRVISFRQTQQYNNNFKWVKR